MLEFFAERYGARLHAGNIRKYSYSGDKYNYIISFIKKKYGSLSEYIVWDPSYTYHYVNYYKISLCHDEMIKNMDVVFPTMEDKQLIQMVSGVGISDYDYRNKRLENRLKNAGSKMRRKQ